MSKRSPTAPRRPTPRVGFWRALAPDLRATAKLAGPLIVAQLAFIFMGHVDVAVVGRYSGEALAGVSLGDSLAYGVLVFGMGFPLALEPLVAQALARGERPRAWRAWRAGWRIALWLGFPLAGGVIALTAATPVFGVDQVITDHAVTYLIARAPALVMYLVFMSARSFLQSAGSTRPIVVAAVSANVVNLLVDMLLVHGDAGLVSVGLPPLGIPALGEVGAGIATSASTAFMMLILIRAVHRYKPDDAAAHGPVRAERRAILGFGGPLGLQTAAEYTVFTAVGLMAATIGPAAVSAHRIALLVCTTTFMAALGLGSATAARVGWAVGRDDGPGVRRAGLAGATLTLGLMLASTTVYLIFSEPLAALFAPAEPEVVTLAASLVVVAGIFQVFDGLQALMAGALRGAGDVRVPFIVTIACHWGLGFTFAYLLAFPFELGAVGLWLGLTIGLSTVSTALTWRFFRLTRPGAPAIRAVQDRDPHPRSSETEPA